MFQRPHQPSPRAVQKDYRFVCWPLGLELEPLVTEIEEHPPELLESQWKWHVESGFSILRAGQRSDYPGSELINGHSIDQRSLLALPRLRSFLDSAFPARPTLAWLGRLPRGARIFTHIDDTPHWDEHHRVHVPLITNEQARLCVAGRFLHLRKHCIWLLNNSVPHGALNYGPERLHLVLDLPHFPGFEAWLEQGTREFGEPDAEALEELNRDPLESKAARHSLDSTRLSRLLSQ